MKQNFSTITEDKIKKGLYQRFIEPTKNNENNYIGIEIEIPILNLEKKPVDFQVVHKITEEFKKQYTNFKPQTIDHNNHICSLINKSLIIIPPIIMQKVRAFSHKWYSSMGKKMEPIKGSTCLRSYIFVGTPSVLFIFFITQAVETP